jgi:DNA-binding NtrC family response regulator
MPTAKQHTILIVDDEPDVLLSLTGLLRREFQVYTAESGAEALDIMRKHDIDVIMTDQRMPAMTGTELVSRVRTEHPKSIRIIFTGYADTRAVIDAINSGQLYRYISKPWDPEDLLQVLRDAARQHDEDVARIALFDRLKDYLDDAQRVADAATLQTEDLQQFRSRTEHLRSLLKRLGVS